MSQPIPHADSAIATAGAQNRNPDSPISGGRPIPTCDALSGPGRRTLVGFVLRGRERNSPRISTHLEHHRVSISKKYSSIIEFRSVRSARHIAPRDMMRGRPGRKRQPRNVAEKDFRGAPAGRQEMDHRERVSA